MTGLGEIDDPPRRQLELAHEGAWRDGGLIDLLDLHIGAGLLPELLQHLGRKAEAKKEFDAAVRIENEHRADPGKPGESGTAPSPELLQDPQ